MLSLQVSKKANEKLHSMLFKSARCNIAFQPGSESKSNNWYSSGVTEQWKLWVIWSISQPGPFTQAGLGHSRAWSTQETRTQSIPVENGKHYHGKPRLWMIRLDQTSSHCELVYHAVRRGKMQSFADLRQRARGTSTMALGLQHNSKMNLFIK